MTSIEKNYFCRADDAIKLFIYEFIPVAEYKSSIFFISGISGINHQAEKDIMELLANNENRIVVIHPRGTGY